VVGGLFLGEKIMSISHDGLFQYGGMPVTSNRYNGMWGGKVWFVDYDSGTTGGVGDAPDAAQKNLQTIIDKASAWDTIYIRPRTPDSTGGDPNAIIPASTSNWSIPYTLHGISLIGTGVGSAKPQAYQTRLQGSATVNATAVLLSKAPFATFENLSFKRGGSTLAGLHIDALHSDTAYTFAATVDNCLFWKFGATATNGGLFIDSAWHSQVLNSHFEECNIGIQLLSAESILTAPIIRNCDFNGAASAIDADIYSSDQTLQLWFNNCFFNHEIPAAGAGIHKRYIKLGASTTGMISHCYFASATGTIATLCTLQAGVLAVDCWYAPGTTFTDGT
jgi:hypothetical protein